MTALLKIQDIVAGYTSDIDILRGVSMIVDKGEVRGLIGLNGAGKSTILKTVAGFLPPKSGSVTFNDKNITAIQAHQLAAERIYMIPQESSLFGYMTVRDNLMLPLEQLRRLVPAARQETYGAFEEALELFPILGERLDHRAASLSGGQQKQLEFAKAYILKPRLCMIDEPSIGLAPSIADSVFRWIRLFAERGMAIILVDHNIRQVINLSDYVYVLSLGEISAEGTRETFLRGDMVAQVREWMGLS